MKPHDKKTPSDDETQALPNAEAQLADAAKKYQETGATLFVSLVQVCATCAKLKATFKHTPKAMRPEPTWPKYVASLHAREILTFGSDRMANYLVELDRDLKKVDIAKVKKLAPDGSYKAVNSAVKKLLGESKLGKTEKPPTWYLTRALKELQAAEAYLPEAKLEIGSIKASIQKLLDGSQTAAPGKVKPVSLIMPGEWLEKFTAANAKPDQVTINAVVDELWAILQHGGATGFPSEVTFGHETNDLGELLRRYNLIKGYMGQVRKALGYNFAMPKPPAAQTTTAAKISMGATTTATKVMFKPKNVAEIAQSLGSKSALGRAVGKSSQLADYWAKVNKFPAGLRSKLMKVFDEKNQLLDLSLIAITK